MLLDNKCKFLESQRDNYKSDLNDLQKKFDLTIENLSRKQLEEKEKTEKSFTEKIQTLETKYNQQIKDSNEKHSMVYTELFNTNKALVKEVKDTKLELEIKNKALESANSNKSVEELTEQLEKVKAELEISKKSNLTKSNEIRNQMEKEKDDLKKKINDMETKIKEMENKRSTWLFEVELEKGKLNNEKEHLHSSINELKETIETLTAKNEALTKDNMKLKNDKAVLNKGIKSNASTNNSRMTTGVTMGKSGNPYSNVVSTFGSSLLASGIVTGKQIGRAHV